MGLYFRFYLNFRQFSHLFIKFLFKNLLSFSVYILSLMLYQFAPFHKTFMFVNDIIHNTFLSNRIVRLTRFEQAFTNQPHYRQSILFAQISHDGLAAHAIDFKRIRGLPHLTTCLWHKGQRNWLQPCQRYYHLKRRLQHLRRSKDNCLYRCTGLVSLHWLPLGQEDKNNLIGSWSCLMTSHTLNCLLSLILGKSADMVVCLELSCCNHNIFSFLKTFLKMINFFLVASLKFCAFA